MLQFLIFAVGDCNSSYSKALALLSITWKKKLPARSSLHDARRKIGWGFFRSLLLISYRKIESAYGGLYLFKGHPVFAVDGSKLNLPRQLKKIKYKGTHKGCFYPQGMLTVLFRLKMNLPVHFELSRKVAEAASIPRHLSKVPENSVLVYDRLYFSINVLKAHIAQGLHGVFRLRTGGTLKEVTNFIQSGEKEQICTIDRKGIRIRLRLIRYKIRSTTYYMATTLLDGKRYPARSLMDLYHARWGVEEAFKHLKQEIQVEKFHSRTPLGIKQEVAVALFLGCLSGLLCLRTGRKHKISKGVGTQALVSEFPSFWTGNGTVRKNRIENLIEYAGRYRHQSPANRSFPRRSRKVINRWQKSIAWEWDKKKRQAAKGKPP